MHTNYIRIPTNAQSYTILDKDSIIQCEEMRCLSKARLISKRGVLLERDLEGIQILKKMDLIGGY